MPNICTNIKLDDAESIQGALMQVIDLLLKDQIEAQKGRIILRAIELASRNLKNLPSAQARPAAEQHDRAAQTQGPAVAHGQTKESPSSPSSSAIRQAIHAADSNAKGKAASEPILRVEVNAKGEAVLIERVETPAEGVQKKEVVLSALTREPKKLPAPAPATPPEPDSKVV
jgi:hypothetical protein